MPENNIRTDHYLAMVFGGILIVAIAPRDPWSIGLFIYLYACSIIGCTIGILRSDSYPKAFIKSIIISTILHISGIIIADIHSEGQQIISEYIMWLPIMIGVVGFNMFGATLTAFPIVNSTIYCMKRKKNA